MRYTEATLVGVFGPSVHMRLSKPLHGARWRHAITTAEGYVSDLLTYCARNVPSESILSFVRDAVGESAAVLVIEDEDALAPSVYVLNGAQVGT